jgi:hypothetical protein
MNSVAGVFQSQAEAEHAREMLATIGLGKDRVVLLTRGGAGKSSGKAIPTSDTEQPGMGTAMGGVIGGAVGVAGGAEIGALTAVIPGVGPVIAMGILGGAILGLAGARAGGAIEDSLGKGLPADELFIYEDALRQGRSVIVVFPDPAQAGSVSEAMANAGAESINSARKSWWLGLRNLEKEHYTALGRTFDEDENFYRMGFEAAMNPRYRDKSGDQVLIEMTSRLEDLWSNRPRAHVAEAFLKGYERGQAYSRSMHQKAA